MPAFKSFLLIRSSLSGLLISPPPHPQSATFTVFEPVSLSSLSTAVGHLRASNCPSDCLPSSFIKNPAIFNLVAAFPVVLVNTILASGRVPAAFKHTVVQPLLEKSSLDPSVLAN